LILRKRGLILAGIVAALVTVVVLFPARVAYKFASPPLVAMSGLSGTIWNGTAREFSTHGIYLRNLEWHLRPLSLFSGLAAFTVSGEPANGFFDSEVAVNFSGSTVTLRNLSAALPLAMFANAVGVPGLRGSVSLQVERLELVEGRAVALDGSMDIGNVVVPLLGRGPLGGYRADFFTQNDRIVASVEDTDGVVDLAGSLQLNPDKTYSFRGLVMAKPNTPDNLRQRIEYLPKTDRPGQHELRLDGSY
jgi:general secretion pathway protein N